MVAANRIEAALVSARWKHDAPAVPEPMHAKAPFTDVHRSKRIPGREAAPWASSTKQTKKVVGPNPKPVDEDQGSPNAWIEGYLVPRTSDTIVSESGNTSNRASVGWLAAIFGRKPQRSHGTKLQSSKQIIRQQKKMKQQNDAMAALAVHVCRNAMHPFMPGIMGIRHDGVLEHRQEGAALADLSLAGVKAAPAQSVLEKCTQEGETVAAVFEKARESMLRGDTGHHHGSSPAGGNRKQAASGGGSATGGSGMGGL